MNNVFVKALVIWVLVAVVFREAGIKLKPKHPSEV